ncbi:Broad specificity phosphatase PhoE [Paracoccus halophilus]|uniref:Broad specificity phosphatase PhoE n=1 Tax=Paracoccus halophilus TaxID=376733 RepID=A0A1I0U5B1_9RHOB|nr:histidine phosphatase family protein [Paracoccus halophilus]SFA59205.1 Broad specificity phosphatase PhoE [Paracoccus halophilus]
MAGPRVTLLAHAATRGQRSAVFAADGAIEEAGRIRAGHIARRMDKVDRVYFSPARAARETAEALGLSGTPEDALRDCDYGRWAGQSFQHVLRREPRKLLSWMRQPDTAPHGGETIAALLERVGLWFQALPRDGGHVLAISHAAILRAAIATVIGAGPAAFWRIDAGPLTMADFRSNGRRWVFRSLTLPDRASDIGAGDAGAGSDG